ncbi:hypothetical protein C8Q75DRAFT_723902, partial [Abortiporus biennis]
MAQEEILRTANEEGFELVLLQEPWIDSFGKTRGSSHYCLLYPPTVYTDPASPFHSVILIRTTVPTNSYIFLPVPHKDITALRLHTTLGDISIFNIY